MCIMNCLSISTPPLWMRYSHKQTSQILGVFPLLEAKIWGRRGVRDSASSEPTRAPSSAQGLGPQRPGLPSPRSDFHLSESFEDPTLPSLLQPHPLVPTPSLSPSRFLPGDPLPASVEPCSQTQCSERGWGRQLTGVPRLISVGVTLWNQRAR